MDILKAKEVSMIGSIYIVIYLCIFSIERFSWPYFQYRLGIFYVLSILLFVFAAFRYEVGCDWVSYFRILDLHTDSINNYNKNYKIADIYHEPGFWVLNAFVANLGGSVIFINIATSAIFFLGLSSLAKRTPDPLFFLICSFPILILNMPMSAIRQAAAIGLLCFAFGAFIDQRPLRFMTFVILASMFHASAIIFIALFTFIGNLHGKKNYAIGLILSLPGVAVIVMSRTVDFYIERYSTNIAQASGAQMRTLLISLTGIVALIFLRRRWQRIFPNNYRLVMISSFIMICLFPLSFIDSIVADRIGYYFIPIQLIILTSAPFILKRNALPLYLFISLGYFIALLFWTQLSFLFELCFTPYQLNF